MNKITKALSAMLFVALVVPQVALASWWNPFSWFAKKSSNTEILEKKIIELEGKLNSISTTTDSLANTKKELNKTNVTKPRVDSPTSSQVEFERQVQANLKAKSDKDALLAKQKEEELKSALLKNEADKKAQIDAENARQATIKANEEAQRAREEKEILDAQIQQAEIKQQSLNAINLKIANLNAKYAKDIADVRKSGGMSTSQANTIINVITSTYQSDYNILTAEFQLIKYGN